MRGFRRIVVAVDFSPGSRAALDAVARLRARGARLRVHLVHVIDPTLSLSAGPPTPVWSDVLGQLETAGRKELERLATRVRTRFRVGVRVETHLVHGGPATMVCTLAARVRADLIVVGTHGRSGLAHVLLGSVAERVVRQAGRPVLTVPARGRRAR